MRPWEGKLKSNHVDEYVSSGSQITNTSDAYHRFFAPAGYYALLMKGICPKCGSKVEEINVEMAFARGKAAPVYVFASNSVCLDCGFAECFLPQESLAKLRELFQA
jgi:hypothetical protein